jgi:hypothetical protein
MLCSLQNTHLLVNTVDLQNFEQQQQQQQQQLSMQTMYHMLACSDIRFTFCICFAHC